MVASNFDSFDASGFDAFIESPFGARNPGVADKLLVWPNPSSASPFVPLPRYIVNEIGPEWDMQDTWSGNINDYRAIVFSGLPIVSGYDWTVTPPWASAVRDGQWSGRILLDAIGDVHGYWQGFRARAIMNNIAGTYGVAASESVVFDPSRPFNGSTVVSTHPLLEGVSTIGHWGFNGTDRFGMSTITGAGEALDTVNAFSVARAVEKEHPNGARVSLVMAGSGAMGTPADPGPGGSNWIESSYQFARNFWNVPI